jgi:Na+-transporting methylmalonyl-CoA/oxaloacetate decarboxylase gamma subunit
VNVLLFTVIGVGVVLLVLLFPHYLRWQVQRSARRELQKSLSERDPEEVIEELDAKIRDQLALIAELEANAGVIYGAGGDELIHREHRDLRLLKQNRKIAADYIEGRLR